MVVETLEASLVEVVDIKRAVIVGMTMRQGIHSTAEIFQTLECCVMSRPNTAALEQVKSAA